MCGIVGAISVSHSITPALLRGLEELQNRGYDSMGVSLLQQDHFQIVKDVCKHHKDKPIRLFDGIKDVFSFNGIAHSRWATHGGICQENAHPHSCFQNLFCLVHNGIIENCHELKEEIMRENKNITFRSETDSEVIVNLISTTFQTMRHDQHDDVLLHDAICNAIYSSTQQLRGTFGLVIQCRLQPNHLFCIRYGSPLVVGVSKDMIMVVSEKSAFRNSITEYTNLDNHDLVVLQHGSMRGNVLYTMKKVSSLHQLEEDEKGDYETWTEKEIMEQPFALRMCINNGSRILPDNSGVQLGGLDEVKDKIQQAQHIILMGCGTSFHACLIAASYFRKVPALETVQISDGSEFEVSIIPKKGVCALILVSQSGETMDLHMGMNRFRETHPQGLVLGVVNVVDSLIASHVDAGVYTNCGRERGVASTKSFTTQVIVLFLIACYMGMPASAPLLIETRQLSTQIDQRLPEFFDKVRHHLLPFVKQFQNLFVVGKHADHCVAMESALKIKEISYMHAEAYSSSSLKHGPFALLDENMLVILLSTIPAERKKMENAYQEISARNSPIVVVSYENIQSCPYFVKVGNHGFAFLEANIVMQILALELSIERGNLPDFPRNLAKCVTVE